MFGHRPRCPNIRCLALSAAGGRKATGGVPPVGLVEAADGPAGAGGGRGEDEQDPVVGDEGGGELVVRRGFPAVLLADGAEQVDVGRDVLADCDRGGDLDVAQRGRVVYDQLRPGVALEDAVLRAPAGGGDVEV